jgi:PPOX class probable F420-dependent enzyme
VALDPSALPEPFLEFLRERHLATLTTARPDGTAHVVPVGFTFDPGRTLVRVLTSAGSRKARNLTSGGRAVICQVDGRRWVTLEGAAAVRSDDDAVAQGVAAYAERYRVPRPNPDRVVVEILVDRAMGRS